MSIISLTDPATAASRQYLFIEGDTPSTGDIFEMNRFHSEYSSHFVGSRVCAGDLHVTTRVDPLYFILDLLVPAEDDSAMTTSETRRQQWEPLAQLLSGVPEYVMRALRRSGEEQIGHLCDVNNELGDVILYRFNRDKVLQWLRNKHQRVTSAVKNQQMKNNLNQQRRSQENGKTQLIGYIIPEDNILEKDKPQDQPEPSVLSETQVREAQQTGLQIVCNYLNEQWVHKLLRSLEMTNTDLSPESSTNHSAAKRQGQWDTTGAVDDEVMKIHQYATGQGGDGSTAKSLKNSTPVKQSAAMKRLAKVDKKGMKSLSSFFGVATKKQKIVK
eukprot:CAMPEP_0172512904 /NCGR_PEP_ID=MMETSP1066-20121228/248038_1 /TAXON_ID=671091 /ORGANISM="Coscinodiscus wailesii, Strain CCMP2513" /LENGTH=328 /DNA_ID=CAMNT_0013292911 /DNA_START=290 /DNA_END=1276 /DNA_ORIENTATION=+